MLHYRIQRQGLPIGIGVKPQIFLLRFSSPVPATSQPVAALLRPSQLFLILFTTLLNSSSFFHLFPPQLNSFHLFPALLNSSHLFSPPLNSSHLFLSSCQLFSPLVNSSHLFSRRCFKQRNSYTQKLLHREAFAKRSFCTEQAFTQRGFYTEAEKLLHRETFTKSTFLHTEALVYTENLLH